MVGWKGTKLGAADKFDVDMVAEFLLVDGNNFEE